MAELHKSVIQEKKREVGANLVAVMSYYCAFSSTILCYTKTLQITARPQENHPESSNLACSFLLFFV